MKILVALDPTGVSDKALSRAVDLAIKENAELSAILVALDMSGMGEFIPPETTDGLIKAAKEAAARAARFAEGKGLRMATEVVVSNSPKEAIVKALETGRHDLVVLGSRNLGGLDRFLLGSVAQAVAMGAPCSTLIVR